MNSNVDHEEVNKFAALAARWWDKDSEFKPLHDINPLRLNYIKEQCGGSLEGKRILDVGCGGGILSESLALEGASVVGIDLAEAGLPLLDQFQQHWRLQVLKTHSRYHRRIQHQECAYPLRIHRTAL